MTYDLKEALSYVKARFSESSHGDQYGFRDKLTHTLRVCGWAERIAVAEGGNLSVIMMAAVFHDTGYLTDPSRHPEESAVICREYLIKKGFDQDYIEKVCRVVLSHQSRERLKISTPINELVLLEADNLDEKGAMAVLRDCLSEGKEEAQSYQKAYNRILLHHEREASNIMVTPTARRLWEEKQSTVHAFLQSLERDLDNTLDLI